jgi:hypothetical protein
VILAKESLLAVAALVLTPLVALREMVAVVLAAEPQLARLE